MFYGFGVRYSFFYSFVGVIYLCMLIPVIEGVTIDKKGLVFIGMRSIYANSGLLKTTLGNKLFV